MPSTGPIPGSDLSNTPTIFNLSALLANTEYSYAIPSNTRKIQVKVRGLATVQFSFTVNESNTTFITIPTGTVYTDDNLDLTGKTLYLRTNKASQIIEILSWSRN